ncbi:MAG: hypothetical protein FWD21_02900, partial [Peptococcaceae bacterium]|nr:hypothetical protein [Peptococcaceae bacterium]
RDFDRVFQVKEAVEERLSAFINPVTGNFDGYGWGIGFIPDQSQIVNCLRGIAGVSCLASVTVSAFPFGQSDRTGANLEQIGGLAFCLPLSGKHEISIVADERRKNYAAI